MNRFLNKMGFTLAEVLITLGIIGVVAAMTIPGLIEKANEKIWLSQFKKTYSTLSQAYKLAAEEYGTGREWELEDSRDIYEILKSYLQVASVYDIDHKNFKDLDNVSTARHGFAFSLQNGAILYPNTENLPNVLVDINGGKAPNQLGKDMFFLYFNNKGETPVITGAPMWWIWDAVFCDEKKNGSWHAGGACADWIISKWNMDYLHRTISLDEWQQAVESQIVRNGKDSL